MGGLENTNRQLAEQLQEHSDQLDTVSDQLDTVSDQLGTVLVGNTSTDIIQELENTNRQLAEQLQEHSDQLDTVTDQLDTVSDQLGTVLVGSTSTDIIQKLNASVTELRSKVNISVSPFSNCIQERTTCSIGAMGGTLANGYHFQCYPPQQDVNREGFYTVNVRCEYSSNNGYFAATHLQYAGPTVFCFCDLIYPNFNTGLLQVLPQQTTFTCNLVIDRCPIS